MRGGVTIALQIVKEGVILADEYRVETRVIHAGQEPDATTGAIMTPVYQTSTYVQRAPGDHSGYEYSRTDNPTRTALQDLLAALEGGRYGLAFASGMAATDTVLRLLNPDDHVIAGHDLYGGTVRLFDQILQRYGLRFSYVDVTDHDAILAALRPETKLIWLESPTNPMMSLADIAAISDLAPDGVWVAVDNTMASSYLQQPLALGADIVVHSTTKYLGGHSDVVGGAVIVDDTQVYEQLKFLQNAIGAVPGPQDCWLVMRGVKTLHLRMERHSQNALQVARFLSDHPAVEQVYYPGLETHPQHELASRQMRDFGGMLSLTLRGGHDAAHKFVTRTRLFALAESLGGVESLVDHPHSMTHASTADGSLAVDAGLVRLSVGVEHIDDLLADLQQALEQL